MLDVLESLLYEAKHMLWDWPIGTFVGAMIILLAATLAGFLLYEVFTALDFWFLPRKRGVGKVTSKAFTPAHTELEYNAALGIPMEEPYGDDFSLNVICIDGDDSISVDRFFYNNVKRGDQVQIEYVLGRLTGRLALKGIAR